MIDRLPHMTDKMFAYHFLKNNIMNMDLNFLPGKLINEANIGKTLEVSRTPVREALIYLTREHLIQVLPQKGSYVTKIDMHLVEEGAFMRKCLEQAVYPEAAKHITPESAQRLRRMLAEQKSLIQYKEDYASEFIQLDDQFHAFIFQICGKSNIWDSIVSINTHYNRLRLLELQTKINIYKVLFQHEALLNAIEANDTTVIGNTIDEHMGNMTQSFATIQENFADFFK